MSVHQTDQLVRSAGNCIHS